MFRNFVLACLLLVFSTSVIALPNFSVQFKRNAKNIAEVQITNQTLRSLVCYVAIDGRKIFFLLRTFEPSKWYKATDPAFNYSHFSTWCDYLYLYPEYMPKKK
ncbi:MAG: hypothetical protein COB83_02580 [Gammaproteobacteria bacterium]|nr:MAG: hypothetical protein COB83_02580 [Gammaproteobacteria bacterium]